MAKSRELSIRFPVGGVDKRMGFQQQPPFTSPDALNVWPETQEDQRERGGSRPGLAKITTTQIGGGANKVNMLARMSYVDSNGVVRRCLVAASNGQLWHWREGIDSDITKLTTTTTLASNVLLLATEHQGKLYIADYSTSFLKGTDGTLVADAFDSATYTNWTATTPVINKEDYVVTIRAGGNGPQGNWKIKGITAGSIEFNTNPGADSTGIHFYVERSAKVFDPAALTLTRWDTDSPIVAGTTGVPTGCPVTTTWRDRVVMAGSHDDPHNWYMSRSGNANNFDYFALDAQSAVAGNNTTAGKIGEPVNSIMVLQDDCMVVGCDNSLWAIRGDPADGGSIVNLSWKIGCLKGKAFCHGADKRLYFMSKDGLYMMASSCGETPTRLSREKLPDDLVFVNDAPATNTVTMAFCQRFGKVYLFISPSTPAATTQHAFDIDTMSWWPVQFGSTSFDPLSVIEYAPLGSDDDSDVIMGNHDGSMRQFQRDKFTDSGSAFTSRVMIGPIRLSRSELMEGVLSQLDAVLVSTSGEVDWELYRAQTAELAVDDTATASDSGTWATAGLNGTVRPRVRGKAFGLKLTNGETNDGWSIEEMTAVVIDGGRRRP